MADIELDRYVYDHMYRRMVDSIIHALIMKQVKLKDIKLAVEEATKQYEKWLLRHQG